MLNGFSVLPFVLALVTAIRAFFRSRTEAALEVLALRQQLPVLKRKRHRPPLQAEPERHPGALAKRNCRTVDHLRRLIGDCVRYHEQDRPHDSLDKDAPKRRPLEPKPAADDTVISLPRLGGLHHRYAWRRVAKRA
jgi:hypothetical protein